MLAPREKLWSTPIEVIDGAIRYLNLSSDQLCYDIGAGDGRFLFRLCELSSCYVRGIEISQDRCQAIENIINDKKLVNRCNIININALEWNYNDADAIFLYLIPRGLRLFYKTVLSKIKNRKIKVLSYMSPIIELTPVEVLRFSTSQHDGAQWPLYVYEVYNETE